jgi:hypothetical protein
MASQLHNSLTAMHALPYHQALADAPNFIVNVCDHLLIIYEIRIMYIDCLAYLCYASDLMTESQILQNYASWAKFIVDRRKSSIQCSTRWGAVNFSGSQNEKDLYSCL